MRVAAWIVSGGKRTGSRRLDGMPQDFCAATLWPSYSLQLSGVRWYCPILPRSWMNAAATRYAVFAASSDSFSDIRRMRRATCAEWPRRSARELSRRLTSTLRSSTNDAPVAPFSTPAASIVGGGDIEGAASGGASCGGGGTGDRLAAGRAEADRADAFAG